MQSREIIRRVIELRDPPRIGMTLPPPFPNDIVHGHIWPDPDWRPRSTWTLERGARWEDEWGNVWARLDEFSKGQVVEGALADWADLDAYRLPPLDRPDRYVEARTIFESKVGLYRVGGLPGFPFAIMRYLRKVETFLADVLLYPAEVRTLADRVTALLLSCIDRWAEVGADAVMFAEDWGTQTQLLVSPKLWREAFKPDYRRLVGHAHARGLHVLMHSCGYIVDIIPDLVEVGVDVLQIDQPLLLGIDRLARDFAGRVTFWCPVDIQTTLPTGDLALIESDATELVAKLGGHGGGFIAGYYGGAEAIDLDPTWQEAACRAFVRSGDYRAARSESGASL